MRIAGHSLRDSKTRYLRQLDAPPVRECTAYAVFYCQYMQDNGIVREQQGYSEGHFCVSLHDGAAAETSVAKTAVASTSEDNHRFIVSRDS